MTDIPMDTVARDRSLRRLATLARLLDSTWGIPGTKMRFGLDPILGLIPGIGDFATTLVSLYIILEARKMGVSKDVFRRMVINVILDGAIGAIPVVGEIFDFAYKANQRNLKLLGIDISEGKINRL